MFMKVMGDKVNMQKLIVFLYINNVQLETKITKTMPFSIAPKIQKEKQNFHIYLTVHVQDQLC